MIQAIAVEQVFNLLATAVEHQVFNLLAMIQATAVEHQVFDLLAMIRATAVEHQVFDLLAMIRATVVEHQVFNLLARVVVTAEVGQAALAYIKSEFFSLTLGPLYMPDLCHRGRKQGDFGGGYYLPSVHMRRRVQKLCVC